MPTPSGTGESTTEARAGIERLAMETVKAAVRELGQARREAGTANVGYDIESRDAKTKCLRFIEVKVHAHDAKTVTVTHQEMCTALNAPDSWIPAIVRISDG